MSSLNTNRPRARADDSADYCWAVKRLLRRYNTPCLTLSHTACFFLHVPSDPANVFMAKSPDISVMTRRLVTGRGLIGACKWSLINCPSCARVARLRDSNKTALMILNMLFATSRDLDFANLSLTEVLIYHNRIIFVINLQT